MSSENGSAPSIIERLFRLRDHGTSLFREVAAGLATFAAMAYILVVNPDILSASGMDKGALITATAIASAIGTLLMALLTNYPIACAPGMGINAYFSFSICLGMGVPWQGALGMVFWNGVLFLILALTGLRGQIVNAIPQCLKVGIQVGIGIFIAFLGLQVSGVIVNNDVTLVGLGQFATPDGITAAGLCMVGVVAGAVLIRLGIPGAILVVIILAAAAGLYISDGSGSDTLTQVPDKLVDVPASLDPLLFKADLLYPFREWEKTWTVVLALLFVDMFDGIGTLIGVSKRARLTDGDGNLPKMKQALAVDAISTTAGALLGTSPVTPYIESATGVQAGGRTGFTAVVVALCFLVALFFHPLIVAIPRAAAAPALILVGISMLTAFREIDWEEFRDAVPAAITALMIPFGFGIANGIALGCIAYAVIMAATGRAHRVHLIMYVLAALFVAKYIFVGNG